MCNECDKLLVECSKCKSKRLHKDALARFKERRIIAGLCIRCGSKSNGLMYCEQCRANGAKRALKRFKEFLCAGLCARCGKISRRDGKIYCDDCARKSNNRTAKGRLRRSLAGLCRLCNDLPVVGHVFCQKHIDARKLNRNVKTNRFKAEVLSHYGSLSCKCCGEDILDLLTLDHLNGGGTKHRKMVGGGAIFYRWLRTNGYPDGYEVLCFSCNFGRSRHGGICPHKFVGKGNG